MQIYLPIAEIPVDIITILVLGGGAGFLAGMFGVGGGFIVTPFLIFIGIPPSVAVASSANQIIASSVSGFASHLRRKSVDFKMGSYLLAGGLIGSYIGTLIFSYLKKLGQIDLVISLSYVLLLGSIGMLMTIESYRSIVKSKKISHVSDKKSKKHWRDKLPFKVVFPQSKLKVSFLLPIVIGVFSGMIVSIMGIGGGFITIPAMIYILGIPTTVVIGTSLFQMIIVTSNVTFFHAYLSQTVDIVLAMLLLTGSVVGAQIGSKMSYKVEPQKLRIMLAMMILVVASKMALGLLIEPENPFSVEIHEAS